MTRSITHGWVTAEPDDASRDVSARNLNDHQEVLSGLTAGHVLRASSATAADFAAIQDSDLPSTIARDSEVTAAVAAEAALARDADNLTSGTVADARIASTIARDSEVTSAISALSTVYQPLDSDLTAIAALSTTAYGRALLALADASAGRTALGLGTAATVADSSLVHLAGAETLTVQAPDGTQTTPTPTSSATGTWTADVSVTMAGVWWYRFVGTGAVAAAAEGLLSVRRRRVA